MEQRGLSLLKKGHRGVFRFVFGRMVLVTVLLVLNFLAVLAVLLWFSEYLLAALGVQSLAVVAMVVYLLNSRLDPTAKICWLVVIFLAPLFGSMLFLFTQSELGQGAMKIRLRFLRQQSQGAIRQDPEVLEALRQADPGAAAMTHYVARTGCYPVFSGQAVTYFPLGEDKLRRLLQELEKAEKYIYLEYFIIDEGLMWGKILQILARKAKQGVDVRVMYDGTCEFSLLPRSYPRKLEELGIRCKVFSRVTPFVSTHYNYRDHRKILVIDGAVAFNGGINLADEYINHVPKHGHWKDTAVMVEGAAARSFALMFLQLWDLTERVPTPLPEGRASDITAEGFVMPYADDPLDQELVGRQVYMDLLDRAKNYVHIMTPYLILDAELEGAICYAAKRGVEVALLLPGIPDKKIPYAMAKSHYKRLLDAGVKIYEYTPGFVHAKVLVCDDKEAVVGTINLDYRSLYHHFECATYLYGAACIGDIEDDFTHCVRKSRTVTYETVRREKWHVKLMGYLMKLVAPLM
ncbi:MAG: cardiolipin synthase [Oscillospiraceae bacterium]|nr:cardiolipin synthase [Oscillospiraceae bacterium]